MAKEKEILQVNVRKDEKTASRTYGCYFGEAEYKGLLSTRALAEHIASHGSIWTRDIVEGILKQLQICIPEKVCQGYGVELQGIGIFYPTAKGRGCDGPQAFNNVSEVCDGIRIRFNPELKKLDALTAKAFKEHCSLSMNDCVRTIYEGEGENKKKVKTLHMPYDDWRELGCPELSDDSGGGDDPEP